MTKPLIRVPYVSAAVKPAEYRGRYRGERSIQFYRMLMGLAGLGITSACLFVAAFELGWITPVYEFFLK